jgi:hypothetical protein
MKRVALFLALLLVGGLVLWLLDSSRERPLEELTQGGETPAPLAPAPEQRGALTDVETSKNKSGQIAFSGPFEVFAKDLELPDQPLWLHVKARDSRTVDGGLVDLEDVEFERYDSATRKLDVEGKVGFARVKLLRIGELDASVPIPMRDTQVTYHSASRFSPLRLETPELEIDLANERAQSDQMVAVTAAGFAASGHGLRLDGKLQELVLQRDPRARIEFERGGQALLVGRGALTARARPDLVELLGPQATSIEVLEGANLTIEGAQPLEVDARSLTLVGRLDREGERFFPVQAQATGEVLLTTRAGGLFRSDRLVIDFDERGEASRAAFDGRPMLDIGLVERALANVPPELLVEGDRLTVHGEGAGPLEVFFGAEPRFEFNGPAKLTLPALGSELSCQTRIEGKLSAKGEIERVAVIGDARGVHEGWTVRSERLEVESFLDGTGRDALRIAAPQAASLSGELDDGDEVELRAEGGLAVDSTRTGVFLRNASRARIEQRRDGVLRYVARADEVREFDPDQLSFLAEGDVEFAGPKGRGRGERLEAWAIDRGELSGTLEAPARLEALDGQSVWGVFEAPFIEAQGELVHARGGVRGAVELEGLGYELRAPWVAVERRDPKLRRADEPEFELDAGGGVIVTMRREDEEIALAGERFHGEASSAADADGRLRFTPDLSLVTGDVNFDYRGAMEMRGLGEKLELRGDRTARLTGLAGQKVRLRGTLPRGDSSVDLLATQVDFSPERVTALSVEGDIEGIGLAFGGSNAPPEARKVRVIAGALDCDARSLLLSDAVYLGGKTERLEDWDVDCEAALVRFDVSDEAAPDERFNELLAWGGFQLRMGSMGAARGERMELSRLRHALSLFGAGAQNPAQLERGETVWASQRMELDLETGYLRSEKAVVRPLAQDLRDSWTLEYEALEPLPAGDETIQIFRAPVWRSGEAEVRAAWALAWVDAAQWRALGLKRKTLAPDPDAASNERTTRFFGRVDMGLVRNWLHEIYLDGDVEQRLSGETQVRAGGIYMDLVEGHGWIVDAILDLDMPVGGRRYQLKLQADWLRSSLDGEMETRNAVATTCSHDEPHYVIKIGNFSRKPYYVEKRKVDPKTGVEIVTQQLDGYEVALEGNAIDFFGPVALPLPRIAGRQDAKNKWDPNSLSVGSIALPSFGQDSKLGTFISANFTTDIGPIVKGFHWLLNQLFGGKLNLPIPKGSTRTHADLNSRGLIVGTESRFESTDKYRWSVIFDAIYDRERDRGLVRVDRADRGDGRAWLRARGRHFLGSEEWVDIIVSRQSDPGVQAEFFERDYLYFEERESLVHWRRAEGEHYTSATAEARLDDFRSEIVDQPRLNLFKGRSSIGRLGSLNVVQSSLVTFANLARFEGDPRYNELPFQDGLGERNVLRIDGSTRVETPWTAGTSGVRFTPFAEARMTGWSENAADDGRSGRAALTTGVQASTTFWKRFNSGSRHVWTPTITYRGDLAHLESGEPVARFDTVDDPIEGRFLDLAVRSRWEHRELASDLDVEVVQTHAESVAPGQNDGWLPLVSRSTFLTRFAGMPMGFTHDGRYDLASGETNYSRSLFGIEPTPGLDLEVGYHRARDLSAVELYDAATVGARYQFTRKWEVEGRQTFSAADGGDQLAYSLTLRRFGHDFVFEIENSVVAGEGRSSLRFKFTPLFVWRNASPTMLDQWRAARQ